MDKDLRIILKNAKGKTISIYRKNNNDTADELKLIYFCENMFYKIKKYQIIINDLKDANTYFSIDKTYFMGANAKTNEVWVCDYIYTLIIWETDI